MKEEIIELDKPVLLQPDEVIDLTGCVVKWSFKSRSTNVTDDDRTARYRSAVEIFGDRVTTRTT